MTSKKKRQRGSKTHSTGSMKNKRGAGHKGGRGRAGTGKRGDAVKPSHWKKQGKKGFTSLQQKRGRGAAINISDVNEQLETLKDEGVAYEEDGELVVDLEMLGIEKLLGSGEPTGYSVVVKDISDTARDKIEGSGGSRFVPE